MKKLLLSLFVFLSAGPTWGAPNSEALKLTLESQPSCGRVVRFDEVNIYQGFGAYRKGFEEPRQPIPGKLRVAPINGEASYELPTHDAAIDVLTEGELAYVLTYSTIEIWNLKDKTRIAETETYAKTGPKMYQEHATSFA